MGGVLRGLLILLYVGYIRKPENVEPRLLIKRKYVDKEWTVEPVIDEHMGECSFL